MFDPENPVGWRARWIAREHRLVYTYGEHVLLALLENPTPEVAEVLKALEEDPAALRADVDQLVQGLARARRVGSGHGEADAIENAACDLAKETGYCRARPEHLLLAILSPLRHGLLVGQLTEAGRFLVQRGIKARAVRAAIRPPEPGEQAARVYEPPQQHVWLNEGWKAAVAAFRFERHGFSLSQYEFRPLITRLEQAGEWAMLAHLFEMLAASNMLEYGAAPDRGDNARTARYLIMAALWLRKDGDHGRARLIAERAIHELGTVHTDGKPNPGTLATPIDVAFAFEMMGDAALCIDPDLARTYWLRATEEFRYIDATTQDAEWNEPWCHGWYLADVHRHFLSGDARTFGWDGAARVADKMKQWLP